MGSPKYSFINQPIRLKPQEYRIMNKSELITRIANDADVSKVAAERVLDALASTITDTLKSGGEVSLHWIGKFCVGTKAARTGRNPHTGAEIHLPERKAPKFKISTALKFALN